MLKSILAGLLSFGLSLSAAAAEGDVVFQAAAIHNHAATLSFVQQEDGLFNIELGMVYTGETETQSLRDIGAGWDCSFETGVSVSCERVTFADKVSNLFTEASEDGSTFNFYISLDGKGKVPVAMGMTWM